MAKRAISALGIEGPRAESYGKAAVVGENGELEHAAAILHPKLGAPVRKVPGKGAALIPSSKKRGGPGVTLDVPLGHKEARLSSAVILMAWRCVSRTRHVPTRSWLRSQSPDSGRPLPRVGGLKKDEIKGIDGLR